MWINDLWIVDKNNFLWGLVSRIGYQESSVLRGLSTKAMGEQIVLKPSRYALCLLRLT